MLRLDPGEGRVHTARQFNAYEGGGEYNVARGLRRCFGLRTGLLTAFADNPIGRLLEDFILQGGVDSVADQMGALRRHRAQRAQRAELHRARLRRARRGGHAGPRPHGGQPAQARRLRLGTTFSGSSACAGCTRAASSRRCPRRRRRLIIEALQAAKAHGTMVSYDLNYRPSPVEVHRRPEAKAQEVNREIAQLRRCHDRQRGGFHRQPGLRGGRRGRKHLSATCRWNPSKSMIRKVVTDYPNFLAIATTLRAVKSATVNDWSAVLWHDGEFHSSRAYEGLEIMDRVGGGDSFASGLIYGFLKRQIGGGCSQLRRGPRGDCHDHAGGYVHGHARRGGKTHARRQRARRALIRARRQIHLPWDRKPGHSKRRWTGGETAQLFPLTDVSGCGSAW